MFMVDVALALGVAFAVSWFLLRSTQQHGPWQSRWAITSLVFACSWAAGAWLSPLHVNGWATYWIPFAIAGVIAALIVVVASPPHPLDSSQDQQEFDREQRSVLISVTASFYVLLGGVLLVAASSYFR